MIVAFYSYTCESGKNTAASFAHEWARIEGFTSSESSFAYQMKLTCANALGLEGTSDEKVAAIDKLKLHGQVETMVPQRLDDDGPIYRVQKGRDFIIGLAESIRALDPAFWIRHGAPAEADLRLITDLRFQREAEWVVANDGYVVEIVRPDTPHKNEDRLPPDLIYDVIRNTGSLNDLATKVHQVLDDIFSL